MLKGFKSAIKWIAAIVIICVVAVFLASINGLNVSRTVISVNGSEISEEEYKFYVEVMKMQVLSQEGAVDEAAATEFLKNGMVEGKIASDYIKEEALKQVLRNETAVVKAKEAGIKLTEEEINAARSANVDDETLKMYNISKHTYADIMEKTTLVSKYYDELSADGEKFVAGDEEIFAKLDEEYALVQHVLIQNKAEGAQTVDEAYAAEAKKKAEDVLAKAKQGQNFAKLIEEYNEDPGMESNPEGYLITKTGSTLDGQSQMVPSFTQGAFAVKPDEVNPKLVESDYGWHIIKRSKITEANDNYITIMENIESSLKYEKFEEYLDSMTAELNVVKKDNILNRIKVKY